MADIKTRTSNFKFVLPRLNQVTWIDDWEENFRAIDALVSRYFAIANYVGVWQNATSYSVGDRVIDTTLSLVYEAQVAHVSPATGTFSDARSSNPTYWTAFTQEVQFRGAWVASTDYAAGDFVTYERSSGNKVFATATTSHTSSSSFEDDETDGLWTVLLEQQDISDADLVAIAAFGGSDLGMLARTAGATYNFRTLTGTANKVTITNGDGVSGNPTFTLPDAITLVTPTITGNATVGGTLDVTGALDVDGDTTLDKLTVAELATLSSGQHGPPTLSKTGNYTLVAADSGKVITADASSGDYTVTLPAAATAGNGYRVTVINTGSSGVVTIDGNGSETINGRTSIALRSRYVSAELFCDGSNWFAITNDKPYLHDRQVASSSANVEFTDLPANCAAVIVKFFDVVPGTDTVGLVLQLSDDNASTVVSSGYQFHRTTVQDTASTYNGSGNTNAGHFDVTHNSLGNATSSDSASGEVKIYDLDNQDVICMESRGVSSDDDNDMSDFRVSGILAHNSTINALRFSMSSGNIAEGIFECWIVPFGA